MRIPPLRQIITPQNRPKKLRLAGFIIPVSPKIASPNYPSPIYDAPVEVVAAYFWSSCSAGAGWMCSWWFRVCTG